MSIIHTDVKKKQMFNGGFGQCEMGIHNHTTGLDHAKNVLVLYLSIVGWVSSFASLVRAFIVSLFSMFTQLRSFLFVILMLNFKIIRVTLNSFCYSWHDGL